MARAEIEGGAFAACIQVTECGQVGSGKVRDMEIVTNRGPVGGGVVSAVDFEYSTLAERGGDRNRDQMRLRIVVLAKLPFRVGAGSVEVTQGRPSQPMDVPIPMQQPFDHKLRLAIRIHRLLRMILGDWNGDALAIGGASGREHNCPDTVGLHRFEQIESTGYVITEVAPWRLHRFTDVREGREVQDGGDTVLLEHTIKRGAVRDIGLNERAPLYRFLVATIEIVKDDWCQACLGQAFGGMASDITGAAGDEYIHNFVLS